MNAPTLEFALELERSVWNALVDGDATADRAALSADFLGVYPSGFAGADGHASQLADGPTVSWYELTETRLLLIAEGHLMLAYLARYRASGRSTVESMYVSSLWSRRTDRWVNVFSQDTPVGPAVV